MKKLGFALMKIFSSVGALLAIILSVLGTLVCFGITWMFRTWSNLTVDEMMYHLKAPLEGTNDGLIQDFFNTCVVPAVLVLLLVLILLIAFRTKKKYFAVMGVGIILPLALAGGFVSYAWNSLDAGDYVKGQSSYSTFIDDNYIDPRDVEITFPEQKRNLIYIFLESMETTYADEKNGGGFSENYIPELTKIAQENEDFSGENEILNGGYALPGTTWTMGLCLDRQPGCL